MTGHHLPDDVDLPTDELSEEDIELSPDELTEENLEEALENLKEMTDGGLAGDPQEAPDLGDDGDLSFESLDLPEPAPEAEPTGVAFRGSERDESATEIPMPFDVNDKDEVWSDNAPELYERAKQKQWDATEDVPWEKGKGVDPVIEEALAQVLTWMIQQEYAAWYVPAKFIPQINPEYSEVSMFLSTQVVDEARHAEVFLKRVQLNGAGLKKVEPSTESSIKGLVSEDSFAQASFLLHILGEGTFKNLFSLLMEIAPDPATEEIMRLAYRDEARHVAYGVNRLQNQMAEADDPDELGEEFVDALERRMMMTYEVSGIPSHVQEALAVMAGGGEGEEQLAEGEQRVERFIEALNEDRKQRLLQAGFSEGIAEEISDLHVRSSGGLM